MIYEVDLDGVLCTNTWGCYGEAEPIEDNISKVNELYALGHIININTGRGSTTGINWEEITIQQLFEWGVNYHSLTVGKKPYYDFIIDDKAINSAETFWQRI